MELQQIKQQLITQLEKEYGGNVLHSDIWCIPVQTYEIAYQPIEKKSMDILMKILLFSFQKSTFTNAEELSDILLVEPLFVEDLMKKLMKNGLLEKEGEFYQLSAKGQAQFSQGIFEEVLDPVTEEILFSPVHEKILEGDIEQVLDFDDFPDEMYRYMDKEEPIVNEETMLNEIRLRQVEENVEIKKILSIEHVQTNDVPCIELVCQKEKEEKVIRVWNTLTENWDRQLEKQISEREE